MLFGGVLLGLLSAGATAAAQPFFPDDPIRLDPDRMPIPKPATLERSEIADALVTSFLKRPEGPIRPAVNVNTLGEVPDSSWYTNRMSRGAMGLDELMRGPNEYEAPDLSQPWEVVGAKSEGLTPGFTIQDARGDVYLVKLDPRDYPQLATSAEVIATRFFHAFGYHVPENYLVFISPHDLEPALEATVEVGGDERPLTREDIDHLLSRAGRLSDGSIPVLASRYLPGEPLGPFLFYDTRRDDPNDIFPHEERRELRGLRVFSAWLHHDDSRSQNTLDMYVAAGGDPTGGYVRHHLIDFGSTLGSASVEPQNPGDGYEYLVEWAPILKAGATLGIWDRAWREATYPSFPAVGNFEAEFFEPEKWKPEYPNPAFERMRPADAFWAAAIVHCFTEEMVRALVATGRFEDPRAEEYLVEALLLRRGKILRHYFSRLNPLDRFELSETGARLTFDNLGLEAGLATVASYRYQWYRYDNESEPEPLGMRGISERNVLEVPESRAPFLMVRIETLAPEQPSWSKPVDVYIRRLGDPVAVGIVRAE